MPIDPPDMPDMKAVDLCGKHKQFVPDSFHSSTCSKPANGVLKKIKDYRQDKGNKKLEVLKLNKDDAYCVAVGMDDEGETHCVDGNNDIKDVGCCC